MSKVALRIGVTAAVTALAVAACGSSSKTTSSNSGGASGGMSSGASTASGSDIVIGTVGGFSGAQASSIGAEVDVFKAWVASVNASGGLAGHQVKLIVKDLGNNTTGGLAAVKDLIENDHVVAIVGEQDNADAGWASYVASKGVPVIGGATTSVSMATNADFFPSSGNLFAMVYGTLELAKSKGSKFGSLYCAESPACANASALYQGLARVVGVTVPIAAKISSTAASYTSVCQQLKDAGVDSYIIGANSAVVQHVAQECATAGVTATNVAIDGTMTGAWAKTPALNGTLDADGGAPFSDTSVPATRAYQTLIAKYVPDLGVRNGPVPFSGYVALQLFAKAVTASGSTTVTADSLKQGLYTLKGETLGGIAPPLTFVKGKPTLVNCYFTIGIENGKFTSPNGLKPACAPDAVVNGIISQLPKS